MKLLAYIFLLFILPLPALTQNDTVLFTDTLWVAMQAALNRELISTPMPGEEFDPNEIFKGGKYLFRKNGVMLFQNAADTSGIAAGTWQWKDKTLSLLWETAFFDFSIEQISPGKMLWNYNDEIDIYLASAPVPKRLQVDADSLLAVQKAQQAELQAEQQRAHSMKLALKQRRLDSIANVVDTVIYYYPTGELKSVYTRKKNKKKHNVLTLTRYYKTGELFRSWDRTKGIDTWYYKDGRKKEESKNGRRSKWYPNGQKSWEKSGSGPETEWYENGQKSREYSVKKEVQWYKNGRMKMRRAEDEPYTNWYPNGVKSAEYLTKGEKEIRTYWYNNGRKRKEHVFVSGQGGYPTTWWKNGQLMQTMKWTEKGTLLTCWNQDGSILWKGLVEGAGDWMTNHTFLELKDDDTVVKHKIYYKEEAEGMVDDKEIIKQ